MINPVIAAQIVELEKAIERMGLTEAWRSGIGRLPQVKAPKLPKLW